MNAKIYVKELGGAILVYALLLVGSNLIDHRLHTTGAVRIVLALTPMIGAGLAAWAVLRQLQRMDEMQRRIQFDAIALAFLGTAFITFSWGFAEAAGAVPTLPTFAIWPIMAVLWVVGGLLAHRRYR